jgi:imidazolonepropionase-like amidohydrolase
MIVIENVRVFDGTAAGGLSSVVIDGAMIVGGPAPADADRYDGAGGVLLPGLIDAHVHVDSRDQLAACLRHGISTVIDMGARAIAPLDALRAAPGLPGLLRAGVPASAPGGMHTAKLGFPPSSAVAGPADAARFVADRVAEGSDFIKVIVEDPRMPGTAALPPETIAAITTVAHQAGLRVVAHVVTTAALWLAADAGVDALTHAPVNRALTAADAATLAARGVVLIPTLVMMRGTTRAIGSKPGFRALRLLRIAPPVEFGHSRDSVAAAHAAGITILAGTDANDEGGAPAHPAHGSALPEELELLVAAGLTPAEAIAAATSGPAAFFGLSDRGAIAAGKRADLLLVRDDPTADIAAVRSVAALWVAGIRVPA